MVFAVRFGLWLKFQAFSPLKEEHSSLICSLELPRLLFIFAYNFFGSTSPRV